MGQNTQSPAKQTKEPISLSFSVPQIIGGALAAATAAAVGSQLGVAGTIIGASVASVIGGVAGTLYSAGLDRTHRRVRAALRGSRGEDGGESDVQEAPHLEATTMDPVIMPARRRSPQNRRRLLQRMVLSAAAIFVVAVASITVIELGLGRSFTGTAGTSIGRLAPPVASHSSQPTATATVTVSASARPDPTATNTAPTPSQAPASPQPTEPTIDPTPVAVPSDS